MITEHTHNYLNLFHSTVASYPFLDFVTSLGPKGPRAHSGQMISPIAKQPNNK